MSGTSTTDRDSRSPRRVDALMTWGVFVIDVMALGGSLYWMLYENLYRYARCPGLPAVECSSVGWYGSMSLTLFGGAGALVTELILVLRSRRRSRDGVWFPIAGLGVILALTALSFGLLVISTRR